MTREKVVVAMSGGVDSSVAALLLKRTGYEVIGITMQVWPRPEEDYKACCGLAAVNDAQRVAWKLDIPHYVMNFRDEFEEKVIGYFCREYLAGRTPNPCIACNNEIKFGSLLEKARALGAEKIATGHYARIERNADGLYLLRQGADRTKDQTYALYQMNQYQLAHTLFPLGNYRKNEVRRMAAEAGLPVARKPESQEICFVSTGSYGDFVEERFPSVKNEGYFRYSDGRILGVHKGIHRYTIGQRRGLGLSFRHPLYVTRIDPETNTVWVGPEDDLYHGGLIATDVNYITGSPFEGDRPVQAKIRYLAPPAEAVATPIGTDRLKVAFKTPQKAITPGQSVVLYDGDIVLGGGVIAEVTG